MAGGILDVQPHVVTVLADTAIRAKDLDEAKAEEAKKQAENALLNQNSKIDYARAQAEIAQAIAQLTLIKRLQNRRKH